MNSSLLKFGLIFTSTAVTFSCKPKMDESDLLRSQDGYIKYVYHHDDGKVESRRLITEDYGNCLMMEHNFDLFKGAVQPTRTTARRNARQRSSYSNNANRAAAERESLRCDLNKDWQDKYFPESGGFENAHRKIQKDLKQYDIESHTGPLMRSYTSRIPSMARSGYQFDLGNNLEKCFPEFADGDVRSGDFRDAQKAILNQIDELVSFASYMYIGLGGNPGPYAKAPMKYSLCSTHHDSSRTLLSWDHVTQTLTVNMKANSGYFGDPYAVVKFDELLKAWNEGEHIFTGKKYRTSLGQKLLGEDQSFSYQWWKMMNPLGELRVTLRKKLIKKKAKHLFLLDTFLKENEARFESSNPDDIKTLFYNVAEYMSMTEEEAKRTAQWYLKKYNGNVGAVQQAVKNMLEKSAEKLFTYDHVAVFEDVAAEKASECVTKTKRYNTENKDLSGFIVVENSHQVAINLCLSGAGSEIDTHDERNIKAKGFIVVSTSDNINISSVGLLSSFLKIMKELFPEGIIKNEVLQGIVPEGFPGIAKWRLKRNFEKVQEAIARENENLERANANGTVN